jgi:hypothetical protein
LPRASRSESEPLLQTISRPYALVVIVIAAALSVTPL